MMKTKMPRMVSLIAVLTSIVITALLVLVQLFLDQPDLSYRSVDQHATMLSNGDLNIEQTIDVVMQERDKPWRQLFQEYTVADSGPTSITDITVTNLTTGQRYTQGNGDLPDNTNSAQWDTEHANQWYLVNADTRENYDPSMTGTQRLELGWNIPATDHADSMRFAISMTWHGAATAYRDVTAMLWEPISVTNEVPIGVLTGTFTFPKGATTSNTWGWLHFTGTSTTQRTTDAQGNSQLQWRAWNITSGQYVDLQVMMDPSLMQSVQRKVNQNHKAAILAREKADEQQWRREQQTRARILVLAIASCALCGVGAVVAGSISLVRRVRQWKRIASDAVYWRQAPQMSPASASILSDYCQYDHEHRNNQIAATMLSLANLGLISLYPGKVQWYHHVPDDTNLTPQEQSAAYLRVLQERAADNSKGIFGTLFDSNRAAQKCVVIVLHDNVHIDRELFDSEQAVLDLLYEVRNVLGRARFDTREMSNMNMKSVAAHAKERLVKKSQAVTTEINAEFVKLRSTQHAGALTDRMALLAIAAGIGFAVLSFQMHMGLVLLFAAGVLWFCGLNLLMLNTRKKLTQHGLQYAYQVVGLRKYMEDYSNFADRDVLSLTLWNDYLVYAVAMGIADTAMRQLVVNYPQKVGDPAWLDSYATGSPLYWMRYGMLSAGMHYAAGGGAESATGGLGQMNVDHMASSFASGWSDFGTVLGGSMTDLRNTIAGAQWGGSGSGQSGFSGGGFSGSGFGGASGGIGGGSFGGR